MAALAESPIEATAIAQQVQASAVPAGMARVWFLRPADLLNGNVWAAAPEIYADGAAIGDIPAGTEFYRDFRPGTYSAATQRRCAQIRIGKDTIKPMLSPDDVSP